MKTTNECLYIIFGEEHYNPLGVIRSLGENNIKPIAIIIKNNLKFASKSKYISKLHLVETIEEGYNILINEYGDKINKPFLITTDDKITSFLDNHYKELNNKFIFFNAGEVGRISQYMDKVNINNLAKKHGISIIKSWVVNVGEIPEDIEYPVITKAIISTLDNWKKESFICNSRKELNEVYKKLRTKKIIIQKFIKKKNELCLDGFSVDKGKKVFYAIASNYNNIIDNAYSNYMTVKNPYDKEIEIKLNKMFKEIGFEGIFSVEFLIDENDNFYFLEINFRNSTWSYASTKAGMNLPLLWSKAMIDKSIVDSSHVDFKEFNAMAEFVDFKDRVYTNQISFLKWIIQLINCKCLFFINLKDMNPIYFRILNKIKKRKKIKYES